MGTLKQGDKFLHPGPKCELNRADPTGKDFVTVTIESMNYKDENWKNHFIIFSFPDLDPMWNKRFLIKYAYAVRPVGSINIKSEEKECKAENDEKEDEEYLPDSKLLQTDDEKS